ncbi:MAG: glycosyltransferase family 4 protein [Candidatus Hydrogenedentes bacterium]|nr:glycosyltransferase family 4 protein [Candidatus Hydrogenedentota bacterium]
MRVVFVDMLFSWPPNGGADVDLYHVAEGLVQAGHEVKLIAVHVEGSTERGLIGDPQSLPFEVETLVFTPAQYRLPRITALIHNAVAKSRPGIVFVQHGYAVKPYVLLALKEFRPISRYYAHEFFCARDSFRYRDGAPCPRNFWETPGTCRRCAFDAHQHAISAWNFRSWTQDYLAAEAYRPAYHADFKASLPCVSSVLVYNSRIQRELAQWHPDVRIVPSGVDPDRVAEVEKTASNTAPQRILMTGRAEDPLKGLSVLLQAGAQLAAHRNDFLIQATHFDQTLSNGWFEATGWLTHEETLARYSQARICVVPSVWEEPFGIVALEAMAARLPVVASRVGGLQDIVVEGECGHLFDPGDAHALAQVLEALLDAPDRCAALGNAGRQRVLAEYTWPRLIEKHYLTLLEQPTR